MGKCIFNSKRNFQTFPFLDSHPQYTRVPVAPHPHQHLALSIFLILVFLVDVLCYLIMAVICISLMINSVGCLFVYLFGICTSSGVRFLFRFSAHVLIKLFIFLLLSFFFIAEFLMCFIYSEYKSFMRCVSCKYFLTVCSMRKHYILTNKNFLIQNPCKCKPAHHV